MTTNNSSLSIPPAASVTLFIAMQTSILHKQVTVELTNGLRVTGRVVQFDGENMNMKLDSLTATSLVVKQPQTVSQQQENDSNIGVSSVLDNPPQLPPMHSIAIRGNHVKWLDVLQAQDVSVVERTIRNIRAGGVVDDGEVMG
jgi:small nuclear ribonucleoprotein (snRNP)-like protein